MGSASASAFMRVFGAGLAAGVVLVLVGAPPVAADIAIPGTHGILQEARIDLGRFADYTAQVHTITQGDTLSAIAAKRLGQAESWPRIVEVNPGLSPDQLKVGAEILVPPRKAPRVVGADGDAPYWWDFYTLTTPSSEFKRLRPDGELPTWRYGTRLYAIRHDQAGAFVERVAKGKPGYGMFAVLDALMKDGVDWLAMAKNTALAHRGSVDEADPTYRRRTEYRVTGIEKGVILLEVISDKRFDAAGKELQGEAGGASARWDLILAFLAALGAAGLAYVLIARRRTSGLLATRS